MQNINPNDYRHLIARYDTRLVSGELVKILKVKDDGFADVEYLEGDKNGQTDVCDVGMIPLDQ